MTDAHSYSGSNYLNKPLRTEAEVELLRALKLVTNQLFIELNNAGGCDHSVGICMCPEYNLAERARAVIAKYDVA